MNASGSWPSRSRTALISQCGSVPRVATRAVLVMRTPFVVVCGVACGTNCEGLFSGKVAGVRSWRFGADAAAGGVDGCDTTGSDPLPTACAAGVMEDTPA